MEAAQAEQQDGHAALTCALSEAWTNCAKNNFIARLVSNHILQSLMEVRSKPYPGIL